MPYDVRLNVYPHNKWQLGFNSQFILLISIPDLGAIDRHLNPT